MAGLSPTQRTLRYLREQGYVCEIVERFNPYAGPQGQRKDLFNIIDIIALDPVKGVIGVQSTGSAFAEHFKKITEEKYQETLDWLKTPGTSLYLIGWRKVKKVRGGKQMVWAPRVMDITLDILENPEPKIQTLNNLERMTDADDIQ